MIRTKIALLCGLLVSTAIAAEPTTDLSNWARFRGPLGTGQATDASVPTKWASPAWKVELPVRGHSSPIVWQNKIFLTGWTEAGGKAVRHVLCVDRLSQKVLWQQEAATGAGESLHKMNSWATPSCATDGERVVAFFGTGGLHCFSVDGKPMWSRDLGDFPGNWGVGASPIFVDDRVVQNCDATGRSYLLAVDKETGKDIWRTPRREKPKGGWSTPVLIEHQGQSQLVLNGEFGVEAYDPGTGKALWFCKSFNGRGTPAPAWGNGLLYMVNGKSGDVYAVAPGGKGDVTDSHMKWHTRRSGGRDLPSPVLVGDVMFVISMGGIATGYDALDRQRTFQRTTKRKL